MPKSTKDFDSGRQAPAHTGGAPSTHEIATMVSLFNEGRSAEVATFAKGITKLYPQHVVAWKIIGAALGRMGRHAEALPMCQKVVSLAPNDAEAHCNLGIAFHELGQFEKAAASYRRALHIDPNYVQASFNLGNALKKLNRLNEAIDGYRQALAINPNHLLAHYNLGNTFRALQRLDEAQASYRTALKINAEFAEVHCNLGITLHDLGRFEEAQASYRIALATKPGFAEAHSNWGATLLALGCLAEAEFHFCQALAIRPDLAQAHNNLGAIRNEQGRFEEAKACYLRALEIDPSYAEAHSNLGNTLKDLGRLGDAKESYRKALDIDPHCHQAHSNLLFVLNYSVSDDPIVYLAEARRYGAKVSEKVNARFSEWTCAKEPARLRVGLVSGDIRKHPVGYFLESLLGQLDPARIELMAYPTVAMADELTARLKHYFAAWTPLYGLSDAAAAKLIHDDGVHVLLDLSGHSQHNRLPLFAWKPTPVQASWLGYFASTGVAEIDYFLGDNIVAPPEEAAHFTETLWRLPDYYMCFSQPDGDLPVGPSPALSNGCITFGCFNDLSKMNDAVVVCWSQILTALPDSRLFLKSRQLGSALMRDATLQRFAAQGVAPQRLVLEGSSPRPDYLATYHRIDIALDPFPYPGGTTTIEGLWMGVPFITKKGARFHSRQGQSIAHNAGLSDWVATDDDDYVNNAISLAADLQRLSKLRAVLRQQVLASPLLDAPRFARHFEEAVWGMWRHQSLKITSLSHQLKDPK